MSKKFLVIIGIVLVLAAVVASIRIFSGDEDGWLCQDGKWIKHGNPSVPMPSWSCQDDNTKKENTDLIKVTKPERNAVVTSPLKIEGEARGTWFFEGSFPVKLLDEKGQLVAQGIATAKDEWMTEDFVPFTAELNYTLATAQFGTLVLMRDNPSDLPQNSQEITLPLRLEKTEDTQLRIFFNNSKKDPELTDCNLVYTVYRNVPKTTAVARAALEELFKGPTESEKAEGFFTNIPVGVKIQKLTIEKGIAKVDLSKELEQNVGGSCRVSAIRAQIYWTLKQFPTVKDVVISIDGRIEDILQP